MQKKVEHHFVYAQTGEGGKGVKAAKLKLHYFVDDHDQNLQSVYNDPTGNSGSDIDRVNGRLFRFPKSGKLRQKPIQSVKNRELPSCIERVDNWPFLIDRVRQLTNRT